MLSVILSIICAVGAFLIRKPVYQKTKSKMWSTIAFVFLIFLSVFFGALTSWINPDGDKTAHLTRTLMASSMETSQVIALPGQSGPQAEILMPGLKLIPLVRVYNDIEYKDFVEVPKGHVGILYAVDGKPLRKGQAIADAWVPFTDEDGVEHPSSDMLNAENFLKYGGQKGEQLTVLKPAKYAINHYLFQVKIVKATSIAAGTVGVVTSRVEHPNMNCPSQAELLEYKGANEEVAVPLVPTGCIGVWKEPLLNGYHFINPSAYKVTIVPTLVQIWKYKGGYDKREIVLTVTQKGIDQDVNANPVKVPKDAADSAITANVEGWKVPTEFSLQIQIPPANASKMVASVGTLADVENKIGTRALRSSYRDTVGGTHTVKITECTVDVKDVSECPSDKQKEVEVERPWQILELITNRVDIENSVEEVLAPELARAGVVLKEVQMGYAELPTGLLATRQREQLAQQQIKTFVEEEKAQVQRQSLESAEALANMQEKIVSSEQAEKIAENNARAAEKEGEGERKKLEQISRGERARANALGSKAAVQLAAEKQRYEFQLEMAKIAASNPDMVKQPNVLVLGDGGDAAVLGSLIGNSSLTQGMARGEK